MYQNKLEDIVKLINKNNSILLAEREREKNTIDNDNANYKTCLIIRIIGQNNL